jgi:hypothetical protein
MDYSNNTCPLADIADPAFLRASHIVSWADCETDDLRLNVCNGLLLSSLRDAAFDAGLAGFTAGGCAVYADLMERADSMILWPTATLTLDRCGKTATALRMRLRGSRRIDC